MIGDFNEHVGSSMMDMKVYMEVLHGKKGAKKQGMYWNLLTVVA